MMFTSSVATVGANGPRLAEYDTYFVTPSDVTDLPTGGGIARQCLGFQVTGAGNVNCNLNGGGTAVFTGLAAGQRVLCPVTRILSTSTTATGITALFG